MKTELITLLIRLIILALTAFVIPAIKIWLEARTENEKLQQIKDWALQAVKAAEQIHKKLQKDDPTGEKRKDFAVDFLRRLLLRQGIQISDKEIDVLIEAAVNEVNNLQIGEVIYGETEQST